MVVFKRMKLLWVLSTIVISIKNNKIITEICLFLANDVPTYIGTVVKSNFQSLIFLPIFKSSQKETAMQRSLTIIKIPLFASDAYLTTLFQQKVSLDNMNLRGRTTECLTYLFCQDSAALITLNQKQLYLFGRIQTSQTGDQPYSVTFPHGECSLVAFPS